MALYSLAIHIRPVLTALVDYPVRTVFRHYLSVVTRHARVRDHQVFVDLAAHTKGTMDEWKGALFAALYENERGKSPGPDSPPGFDIGATAIRVAILKERIV